MALAAPEAEGGVRAARNEAGGRPKSDEKVANRYLSKGSTSPDRIVARLKRDRPDVAERLARGEFRSARAAAIEAMGGRNGL